MTRIIKPATESEKEAIFYLVDPNGKYTGQLGKAVSIWFNDKWVGGLAFLEDTPYIGGGVLPEVQGSGLWIKVWPELITWAHEQTDDNIVMYLNDENVADLMMKLGGSIKAKDSPISRTHVIFEKKITMKFLAENPDLGK
jgi:hypothetical protein